MDKEEYFAFLEHDTSRKQINIYEQMQIYHKI